MKEPRTKTNISRNNKNRGRSFQQEIRDLILDTFPLEADDVKSTSSGAPGEDVQLSPAARKFLPIQIEAKRMKSAKGIYNWVRQAVSHGKHEAVVFIRADREKALAIMDATYYLSLLKELSELKSAPTN